MDKFSLISNNGSVFIDFEKVEYSIVDGYHPSVGFYIHFNMPSINHHGSGYWYDRDNIEKIIDDLNRLENGTVETVTFNAYSELEFLIEKADSCGHFRVNLKVEESNGFGFKYHFDIDMAALNKFSIFQKKILKGF